MPPPRRTLLQTALETETPPPALDPTQFIAQVIKSTGNSLYLVKLPSSFSSSFSSFHTLDKREILVELPPKFRNKIWLRRGGYVVIDTENFKNIMHVDEEEQDGSNNRKDTGMKSKTNKKKEPTSKVLGEIGNIVRSEKDWRKMSYWPAEFMQQNFLQGGSDDTDGEEETMVGKLPPSYSDDELPDKRDNIC